MQPLRAWPPGPCSAARGIAWKQRFGWLTVALPSSHCWPFLRRAVFLAPPLGTPSSTPDQSLEETG